MHKPALSGVFALLSFLLAACLAAEASETAAGASPTRIVPQTGLMEAKEDTAARRAEPMPFYVYNNAIFPPVKNFSPSGYMGDVADLKLSGSYKNLHQPGSPCLRIMYMAEGHMGWAGVSWQNPANNWGEFDGGYNLSKAKKLSFWARGESGGEIMEAKLGGTAANYPDSETLTSGPITLTNVWTEYVLDLSAADLFYISSGFGLSVKQDANPKGAIFYIDDVKYDE